MMVELQGVDMQRLGISFWPGMDKILQDELIQDKPSRKGTRKWRACLWETSVSSGLGGSWEWQYWVFGF